MSYAAPLLISHKRDGGVLDDAAIEWFLTSYHRGDVAEEQMSALLMAIFFRGLTHRELATWTQTMIDSGERLDLSGLTRPSVDKHSTGGVGDKISLVLAPLVAACGAAVPQLSGRGLGHTGGTLDKLESIPGWRASLNNDEIRRQLEDVGAVVCAAGLGLAPIDRRLYALRDVTGTVESIPLIASSIMSKKIAEGTASLVLDVKVGRGAFMKDHDQAVELATTMVAIGGAHGVTTVAHLTNMDRTLGRAVGNALEVTESVEVLHGGGPADVRELTLALARTMLELCDLDVDPAAALSDGSAYAAYAAMIRAQGGDPDAPLATAPQREFVLAERDGIVSDVNPYKVGVAAWRQGAGRSRPGERVSATAGVLVHARPGDVVAAGDPLFELHADDVAHLRAGREELRDAVTLGDDDVSEAPVMYERIDATSIARDRG